MASGVTVGSFLSTSIRFNLDTRHIAGIDRDWKTLHYTRDHLQQCLNGHGSTDALSDHGGGGQPAAVLIGLIDRPKGLTVLLTKRTDHLRDHAGQICFPGGRIEASDPSVEAAALREAEEEIGLPPRRVDVIGRLAPYDTSTGFHIHPVVGWIDPPAAFRPDPFEVAEVFELPMSFVLDPGNHHRQRHRRGAESRTYDVLPYQGRFIWGATAGMLVMFSTLVRGCGNGPTA